MNAEPRPVPMTPAFNGMRNPDPARLRTGIDVVQDRCLMVDHRRYA